MGLLVQLIISVNSRIKFSVLHKTLATSVVLIHKKDSALGALK